MTSAEEIRGVVERYAGAFTRADLDGLVALFAPDATVEDPVGTEPHRGHDSIRDFYDGVQAMAESMTLTLTGPVRCAAGECAFPFRIDADVGGAGTQVDVIDVMTFDDDGRITSMRAFWSTEDLRVVSD